MNSIAQPSNAATARAPHPVDSVASTAAGFLRSLELDRDVLTLPWITIHALSSGAWIDIAAPYGTPAERLDLVSAAAKALGADHGDIRYMPKGAVYSNVEVTGDWAECPITVRTAIATSELVDIETDRAVEATIPELITNVQRHYGHDEETLAEFLEMERRIEDANDAFRDAAADASDEADL